MHITCKICQEKDVCDKVLEEITCQLRKTLNESIKSIKNDTKELKSVWKFSLAENPNHTETSKPTPNTNKLAFCNTPALSWQTRVSKIFVITWYELNIIKISRNIYSTKWSYATKNYNKINKSVKNIVSQNRVFVFPGPLLFAWPPVQCPNLHLLALAPNFYLPALGPNSYLLALPRICIYLSGLQSVFTDPGHQFILIGLGPQFVITSPSL